MLSQMQKYRLEETYRSLVVGQVLVAKPGETVRHLKVRVAKFMVSASAKELIKGAIMRCVASPSVVR